MAMMLSLFGEKEGTNPLQPRGKVRFETLQHFNGGPVLFEYEGYVFSATRINWAESEEEFGSYSYKIYITKGRLFDCDVKGLTLKGIHNVVTRRGVSEVELPT